QNLFEQLVLVREAEVPRMMASRPDAPELLGHALELAGMPADVRELAGEDGQVSLQRMERAFQVGLAACAPAEFNLDAERGQARAKVHAIFLAHCRPIGFLLDPVAVRIAGEIGQHAGLPTGDAPRLPYAALDPDFLRLAV